MLILKDYFANDEQEKRKQFAIDKLENENKEFQGRLQKKDRKKESKIISQANKNFNINVHANRLKKEDEEYLQELNVLIHKKIKYFTNPTLMHLVLKKEEKTSERS